jgi:hypothetical protein
MFPSPEAFRVALAKTDYSLNTYTSLSHEVDVENRFYEWPLCLLKTFTVVQNYETCPQSGNAGIVSLFSFEIYRSIHEASKVDRLAHFNLQCSRV